MSRVDSLRTALEAIIADIEEELETGVEDPVDTLVQIAGTARLALSFDDADAVHGN